MLKGTGHDFALDWWTLGCVLYEMLLGVPPFYNPNRNKMFNLICNAKPTFPTMRRHGFEISPEAMNLISGLLNKEKSTRLGYSDVQEILKHPFFADLDFSRLRNKTLEAPYKPVS